MSDMSFGSRMFCAFQVDSSVFLNFESNTFTNFPRSLIFIRAFYVFSIDAGLSNKFTAKFEWGLIEFHEFSDLSLLKISVVCFRSLFYGDWLERNDFLLYVDPSCKRSELDSIFIKEVFLFEFCLGIFGSLSTTSWCCCFRNLRMKVRYASL